MLLSTRLLDVPKRIEAIIEEIGNLRQRLEQRGAAGPISAEALLDGAEVVGEVTVVIAEASAVEPNLMRQLIDQIRQKVPHSAVLLACAEGDSKVTLVAGISKDLQARGAHAGNWIRPVAEKVGGGGGGRADMAQAGGKQPDKLPEALEVARQTIVEMIGQ